MRFQTELVPARLVRRYKRFLADCTLEGSGAKIVAHCANPGSMMRLADPGTRIWLEPNDDAKRKLNYGWRLVDHENGHFTGVDTGLPNRIVHEALQEHAVPPLAAYETVRREVKYGQASRIDFLLSGPDLPDAYVEVKSVTLNRQPDMAEFPDSVTARGARHLEELTNMVADGNRAIMLYLVQRTDCRRFALADDLDPAYAAAFRRASDQGVETFVFGTRITPTGITLSNPLEHIT